MEAVGEECKTGRMDGPANVSVRESGHLARSHPFLVAIAFFIVIVLIGRWAAAFQYDTDEGLNLIKAVLVSRGYRLYDPIWSDQPPVYTLVLAAVFKVFGTSLTAARLTSAAFGALLIGSVCSLLQRLVSPRAAILGALLMAASAWFGRLSYSAMIGLPALAMATASLALLARWAVRPGWFTLVASALCMAAGIETKFFATVAIPAAWVVIWLATRNGSDARRARHWLVPLAVWTLIVAAACGALDAVFGAPVHQLIDTHRAASAQRTWGSAPTFVTLMRRDWDLVILAAACIGLVAFHIFEKQKGRGDASDWPMWAIVPLVWLICGAVVMQFHRPAWYHHSLLLTIPAAWASAFLLEALFRARIDYPRAATMLTIVLVVVIGWQGVKLVLAGKRLFVYPMQKEGAQLIAAMKAEAPHTKWVFTDLPIYPITVGLACPPEVAVVSTKRRNTGQLTDAQIVDALNKYQPEQVLLGPRIDFGPEVMDNITAHYRSAGEFALADDQVARLYFRNSTRTTTTAQK
jgi:4-amino-4-deoxy-L-arabinose transferase-like glycosyltransferase